MNARRFTRGLAAVLIAALLLTGAPVRAQAASPTPAPDFTGRSWQQIVEDFLGQYGLPQGLVTIGYYNTVTGETHFYDPDRYMVAASMYKVPLAMAIVDKLAGEGHTIQDKVNGYQYDVLLGGMIVNSSNSYAELLWNTLGNYQTYRRIIAPYMGEDPDLVDPIYYKNNYFTARQMLHCLKNLYDGREGPYEYIIDLMGQANPDGYFRMYEDRYPIAQKYGYLPDQGWNWCNCSGIIGTPDPYLLVCFTYGFGAQRDFVGKLCLLMSDYTEYRRQWLNQGEPNGREINVSANNIPAPY